MLRYHVKQSCEYGHIVDKTTTRESKQGSGNAYPIAEGLFMFQIGKMEVKAKAHSFSWTRLAISFVLNAH